jgi:N-acetylglutamate synthase-like GNAT family acetyltransferase
MYRLCYKGIRQATSSDVRDVEEIIRPLETDGILGETNNDDDINNDINNYVLLCFLPLNTYSYY